LYGDYGRDCENRDTPVSFMTVFGVLFSGVSTNLIRLKVKRQIANWLTTT
jgi:hypothetical protein